MLTRPCRQRSALSCAVVAAESHGVAMTTTSQSAAAGLSPNDKQRLEVGHLATSSSRASIAWYFDREPITTE
jgi:hypothetical protein